MKRALLFALCLVGCSEPRTEVVVVVSTYDLVIPRDLDLVRVRVTDPMAPDGEQARFDSQDVPLCAPGQAGNCFTLPLVVTLIPGPKHAADPVRVQVDAKLGAQVVISDASTFPFITGQSERVDFVLQRSCLGTSCAQSEQSCDSNGACSPLSPAPFTGEPQLDANVSPLLDGGADDLSAPDLAVVDLSLPDLTTTVLTCDGGVTDVAVDPQNCGMCGHVCPAKDPNTIGLCSASSCSVGCQPGWAHCSGASSVGCEHDVTGDTMNCGACAHVCGNRNTVGGIAVCTAGVCVFNCAAGTAHCSTDDSKGCEITTASDPHNCGFCGFDCGSALCVNGFCRYTAGAEQVAGQSGQSVLVADATSLYWFNDNGGASAIRKVNKDGTGLTSLWTGPTIGAPDSGAMLAVDKNFLYFFNDTYKSRIWKGVKTGVQLPVQLNDETKLIGASGTELYLDVDDSATAGYVFVTQALNGAGLWRFANVANAAPQSIFNASEARGMVRSGNTLYFGATGDNSVRYIDMHAATPSPISLTTLSGAPTALATDGINVFAATNDGSLFRISIATGTSTKIAANGPAASALATDGINVYATGTDLFRVPVNGPANATYSSYLYVGRASLPVVQSIASVQVDANALYFAGYQDVLKTRK